MMKKITFFMLSMVLAAMFSTEAFAGSDRYAKCVVKSTGNGTVYVSTDENSNGNYGVTSEANGQGETGVFNTNPDITFYRFTKPAEGYIFDGWYTNEACTAGKSSSGSVTFKAASDKEDKPTTNTYYAKFVKLDKVTMTVGAAGYGTFVAPFEVAELPEGVKAYTVSDADGDVLELTEVETIDANTPVVLEGECNQECYGVAAPETAEYGMLVGVYEDTQAPVGSYVLQKHGEVVGFYQVGSETIPTVKANRAYLNAPVSEVRAFFFDSETAIRSVEALTSGKSQIFDLNGRRLNRMQKGINIVNGVKILVK